MKRISLAFCLLFTLLGCTDEKEAVSTKSGDILAGQALFNENCSECHPRTGRGNYLDRIPATLLTRRSKQELMTWIRGSDKHREMPNFVELSDDERENLAAYLLAELGSKSK